MNYYKAVLESVANYDVVLVQLKPEHFDYFDKHNIRYCITILLHKKSKNESVC